MILLYGSVSKECQWDVITKPPLSICLSFIGLYLMNCNKRVLALPENPFPGWSRVVPSYRGIRSSRLDCGDEVHHPSRLVSRRGETSHNKSAWLSMMYGSESWVWPKKNECRINTVEMRPLHSCCGVSRQDRCRNSDDRERCGLKEDVVARVERLVLWWFGYLDTMKETRLTK
ncbi:hypothetical protein EVAR_35750_1 [Eumeta japonica]|uniref:Uncharacterized protein n=1 Tax=Eumeta variegata TaxID=151549 RepID=A0A4C1VER1_EUMVA|nr:hypothetical protein EVAR_35750_1 [Eumeta japonica]